MDIKQATANMLAAYMHTKRAVCVDAGGPADLHMQLDVRFDHTVRIAIIPDRDYIVETVRTIEAEEGQRAHYVGVMGDAVMKVYNTADAPASFPRGLVMNAFEAGDMTIEQLLVISVLDMKTGEIYSRQLPYHYNDVGRLKFTKPLETDGARYNGAILDALKELGEQE